MSFIKTEITHPNLANIEVMGKRIVELESLIEKAVLELPFMRLFPNETDIFVSYSTKLYKKDANPLKNVRRSILARGISRLEYARFDVSKDNFEVKLQPVAQCISVSYDSNDTISKLNYFQHGHSNFQIEFNKFLLEFNIDSPIFNSLKILSIEQYNLINKYEASIEEYELDIILGLENKTITGYNKNPEMIAQITKVSGGKVDANFTFNDRTVTYSSMPIEEFAEGCTSLPTKELKRYK
jgi:hypothetical protein